MTSLGVVFRPQNPPEWLRDVVRAADTAGLDEIWLWEDCFLESGIATAAAALAWTERLRIGIGLLPVPLRNVALTAMEIATLERLFPGRIRVALGHGVQDWMAQIGARVDSPLTLLREHLYALRALLSGDRITYRGRYVRLDGVALDWPPPTQPPIAAGASGPRTLRLSGEAADGTVLTAGTSPEQVRRARRLIDEGRARADRTDHHAVVVYVHAATGPTAQRRLETERRQCGYESMAGLSVTGDGSAIAASVRRWADAGAHTVVLQPTPDEPDLEGLVRLVATTVRANPV